VRRGVRSQYLPQRKAAAQFWVELSRLEGPLDFDQGAAYHATHPDSVASRCWLAPSANFPLPRSGGLLDGFFLVSNSRVGECGCRDCCSARTRTAIATPCKIGVLALPECCGSFVIIKAAPCLWRLASRSASSRFRSLDISEFLAGCWPGLRYSRRSRSLLLRELLALASSDADSPRLSRGRSSDAPAGSRKCVW
jgi:hypothetical protein